MDTAKAQTSLRVCTVCSAPLLFANWMVSIVVQIDPCEVSFCSWAHWFGPFLVRNTVDGFGELCCGCLLFIFVILPLQPQEMSKIWNLCIIAQVSYSVQWRMQRRFIGFAWYPHPVFKYPPKNEIIWSQWDQIISFSWDIEEKWDIVSKANPHTFMYMNPLSRNPGSPVVVHLFWNLAFLALRLIK